MKKSLILLTSALFMLALAAANTGCSGGGDDDDDDDDDGGSLSSGTYAVAASSTTTTCFADDISGTGFYDSFTEADVQVNGASFHFTAGSYETDYDITGTSLFDATSPGLEAAVVDFNDVATATTGGLMSTYNCILDYNTTWDGTITGANAFTLVDTYEYQVNASSTECAAVVTSGAYDLLALPCFDSVQDGDFSL